MKYFDWRDLSYSPNIPNAFLGRGGSEVLSPKPSQNQPTEPSSGEGERNTVREDSPGGEKEKDGNGGQNNIVIRQTRTGGDKDKFVMDKIVNHMVNHDKSHKKALVGENMYRIRLNGYSPNDDTWEPMRYIPISEVLSYFKPKNVLNLKILTKGLTSIDLTHKQTQAYYLINQDIIPTATSHRDETAYNTLASCFCLDNGVTWYHPVTPSFTVHVHFFSFVLSLIYS